MHNRFINAQLAPPSAKGTFSSGIFTVPPLSRGVTASFIVVAGLLVVGAFAAGAAGAAAGAPPPLTVVVPVPVVAGGVD